MRRFFALAAILAAVQLSAGCRHIGGSCDCQGVNKQNGGGCGCGGVGGRPLESNPGVCGYYNGSYQVNGCAPTAPPPPPAGVVRTTTYVPMPQ